MSNPLVRIALLDQMPLYYNALVVESTTRCNARCGMCYQSAGPKGSDVLGRAELAVQDIERLVAEAVKLETLSPRFHLTGGEAFLAFESVVHLLRHARAAGFLDLTTTTNASWARSISEARRVCRRAREAGLTGMEISWDHWHSPYVQPEAVSNCLLACADAGIESNLRVLSSKSHSLEEAISCLDPKALEAATRISCGPVFPTGRAAKEVDRADVYTQGTLADSCHSVLNLTVNARGDVFPCCAGIDQTDSFVFGNVRRASILDIADAMNRSPMLRTIVFGGIGALVPVLESAGIQLGADHSSICHLCWSIFSSPEKVEVIRAHFEDRKNAAVRNAIELLRASLGTGEGAG
ncbi:MAG: SPASM domain-containing protein [Polyangiaceae bacterium]